MDDDLPLQAKVAALLESELASQQVWAIRNIARLVAEGVDCDDLIAQIPRRMWSKSAKVELAAANTTYALLCRLPVKYTRVFIGPILERIAAVPAIEYADCIEKMAAAIEPADVNNSIIPVLDKLFAQDLRHQYAACQILKFLPVEQLAITPESLSGYLYSSALVEENLSAIVERFSPKFGAIWVSSDLPNQLLRMDNRLGITIYFLDFLERIRIPTLYSTLQSIFEWAQADPSIALALLRRAPILMKSRFTDLSPRIFTLLPLLANSPLDSTKIWLIGALADVPVLLTTNENVLYRIFSCLSADQSVGMRKAFLTKVQALYEKVPTANLKYGIVQVFQNMFGDRDMGVLELLINPFMLCRFAETKRATEMDLVLDLADKFKFRWRFFSRILQTIESFPSDALLAILSKLLAMIQKAVSRNPQAVGRSAVSFYEFVIHSRFEIMRVPEFLQYLWNSHGKSLDYRERILYIKFAQAMMVELPPDDFMDMIWPTILEYGHEKVSLVRAKALELLAGVAREFKAIESISLSAGIIGIVSRYQEDNDPQVVSLIKPVMLLVSKRSSSFGHFGERLPEICISSPRIAKSKTSGAASRSLRPSQRPAPPSPKPGSGIGTSLPVTGVKVTLPLIAKSTSNRTLSGAVSFRH
jgi:hypothetical protein